MTIADILSLQQGSVVSLNRREYDPLDVLINGVLFARGEVVRTGEYYGLRILEIL
nr:FliM/FliN family flagellar motor C-terminal domain-containing protein [Endozoicomonas sp. YOMI1]